MWKFGLVALLLVFIVNPPAAAQQEELSELLSIRVAAGYDGWFRPNHWMPIQIDVENNGNDISGRFVVRPETSGSAIPNTFSTPVDLPGTTSQSLFLYAVARGNPREMRVELLDDDDSVIASRTAILRDIQPRDSLYVSVTQAATPTVTFGPLHVGGYNSFQAIWSSDDIPDQAPALEALNMMLFYDVDSGTLSSAQRAAIRTWVRSGGQLVVTGGQNWQATAAAWSDLLPLVPDSSQTIDDLSALTELAGDYRETLSSEVIAATGELIDGARVLAATDDGTPLVARRTYGHGTVDYVAVDPQSLRNWDALPMLWYSLVTSTGTRPSWGFGISDWDEGIAAVEIMPGVNFLPAALALVGFLVAYIALIGPVNYLILSRINRREYAWVTIPILILIFSVIAWSAGFELRGNQATLSRLTLVQTWPDQDEAHLEQVLGLLAPRRGDYNLALPDERLLRPVSEDLASTTGLSSRSLSSTEIRQTDRFAAVDFPVDASFIAAFNTIGTIPKPDISGRAVMSVEVDEDGIVRRVFQGSVRNNSDFALNDPVLLAGGSVVRLADSLEPGEVFTFGSGQLYAGSDQTPAPSPLEYAARTSTPFFATTVMGFRGSFSAYQSEALQSVIDILGPENYEDRAINISFDDDDVTKETRRRQAFLSSFAVDQFASVGRGNRVFLAGWTNTAPTDETVSGGYDVVDTTLYIVELVVEYEPSVEPVTVTRDQFSWISLERTGVSDIGPVNTMLYSDTQVAFRFTPLPDAVLTEVEDLTLIVDRTRLARADGSIDLWNWYTDEWVPIPLEETERITILDPEPYIGPQNAVQIRAVRDAMGTSMSLEVLGVEQRGQF